MPALLTQDFLSHLCGEEVYRVADPNWIFFLSHLCGEEDGSILFAKHSNFLSHLCGEEERLNER